MWSIGMINWELNNSIFKSAFPFCEFERNDL